MEKVMKESSESESCGIPEEGSAQRDYKTPKPQIEEKNKPGESEDKGEKKAQEKDINKSNKSSKARRKKSKAKNKRKKSKSSSRGRKTRKKSKSRKKSTSRKNSNHRKEAQNHPKPTISTNNKSKKPEEVAPELKITRKKKTYGEKLAELNQRSELKNWLIMISLVLSLNFYGYFLVIPNVMAVPLTKYVYGLETDQQKIMTGYFGTSFAIGYLFSNLNMGIFTKQIGRVRTILIMEIIKVVVLICLCIESLNLFLALRAITGLISGLQTAIVPLTGNEMMPRRIALVGGGMFFFSFTFFMFIGSIMHNVFGGVKGLADNWRLVLVWPVVFCFITIGAILSTIGISETPDFYIETVKDQRKLRRKIFKTMKKIYTDESAYRYIEIKLYQIEKQQRKARRKDEDGRPMGWSNLFSKRYRNQLIRGTLICLLKELSGNMFIINFSTQVFDEVSGNGAQITVILTVSLTIGAIISLFVIEFGRKKIIQVSAFIHACSLIIVMVGVHLRHPLINCFGVFFYIASLGCGLCSVFGIYMVEIILPFGLGVAYAAQWILVASFGTFYPRLMTKISVNGIMGIHLFFATCLCIHVNFFCYETKGLSKEEIQHLFAHGRLRADSSEMSLRPQSKSGERYGEKSSLQGSSARLARLGSQGNKDGEPGEGGAGLQTARIVPGGADAASGNPRVEDNIFGLESERGLINNSDRANES